MADSTSNLDSTQNSASVYCLHPSDHANLKLVNIPFDGVGYGDWKRSMIIGLITTNKLCFVDVSLTIPSDTDPNKKAWERCNNMVIG